MFLDFLELLRHKRGTVDQDQSKRNNFKTKWVINYNDCVLTLWNIWSWSYIAFQILLLFTCIYSPRPSLTGHQANAPFSRASDAFPVEACIWESRIFPLSIPTAGEVHSAETVFKSAHFDFNRKPISFIYILSIFA